MAINEVYLYEINDKGENVVVKSLESTHRVYLRFTNRSSRPVDVWWRDFNGKKKHYKRLEAGAFFDINSFLTHVWEFSDASTKEPLVVNNKTIFRAPDLIAGMKYRINWNISVSVRTLRRITMLALASWLPNPEAALQLDLPVVLTQELSELVTCLQNTPPVEESDS